MNIAFNITRRCNKDCYFCYLEKKDEDLSLEQLKKIIYNIDNIEKVTLTGGEALLHEDLYEMLDFLVDISSDINLLTNGTLLNKKTIDKLLPYDPNLFVTYNEIQPLLSKELEYAHNNGLRVNIHHLLRKESLEYLDKICMDILFAKKVLFLYPTSIGRSKIEMYRPEEWFHMLGEMLNITSKYDIEIYFEKAFIHKKELKKGIDICPSGKDIFIDSNGLSYPCCLLVDTIEGSYDLRPIKVEAEDCPFLSNNKIIEDDYERICPLLVTDASEKKYTFPGRLDYKK